MRKLCNTSSKYAKNWFWSPIKNWWEYKKLDYIVYLQKIATCLKKKFTHNFFINYWKSIVFWQRSSNVVHQHPSSIFLQIFRSIALQSQRLFPHPMPQAPLHINLFNDHRIILQNTRWISLDSCYESVTDRRYFLFDIQIHNQKRSKGNFGDIYIVFFRNISHVFLRHVSPELLCIRDNVLCNYCNYKPF